MARTDAATCTPESLSTVAAALQAVVDRLTRTTEAMQEKGVAALEVKNQAGLKSGIVCVRGFAMAAEEALEEWVFDQRLFNNVHGHAEEPGKTRPESAGRKQKKQEAKQQETTSAS